MDFIVWDTHLILLFAEELQQDQSTEKSKVKAKSEEREIKEKPITVKLDINKLRSVVQRNILDNTRLQQKAEARKSEPSRVEVDKSESGAASQDSQLDNVKHHKADNYQHFETENGAVKRKKKKKKKLSERPDCLASQKTLNCDSKSDDLDCSSKPNAGNRFSRVAGPREKPR